MGGVGRLPHRLVGWRGLSWQGAASGGGPFTLGPPLDRSVQHHPLTGSSLLGKGAQGTGLAAQTWRRPRPQSEGPPSRPRAPLPLRALRGPWAVVSEENGSFTSSSGPSAGAPSCLWHQAVSQPRCLRSRPGPQPGGRLPRPSRSSEGPGGLRVRPWPRPEASPRPCLSPRGCAEGLGCGTRLVLAALTAAGQGPAGPLHTPRPRRAVQSRLSVQVPCVCRRRGPSSQTVAGGPGYIPPPSPASGLSRLLGVCELGGEGSLQAQGVVSGGRRARHLRP